MKRFFRGLAGTLVWVLLTPVVLLIGLVGIAVSAANTIIECALDIAPFRREIYALGNAVLALRSLVDRVSGANE